MPTWGVTTWSGDLTFLSLVGYTATYRCRGSVWKDWSWDEDFAFWFTHIGGETPTQEATLGAEWEHFWTQDIGFTADANVWYKAGSHIVGSGLTKFGTIHNFKTRALVPTTGTPTSSSVTHNSATIACSYYINTNISPGNVLLCYKRVVDSTWIQAGSMETLKYGYGVQSISRNLTGLTPSTPYDFKLLWSRDTVNDVSGGSAVSGFTTAAGAPTILTAAATSISHNSATLNATLTINEGEGVYVFWKWGLDNPPTQHQTDDVPAYASGPYSVQIVGLAASTTYYFQAWVGFAYPPGG